MKYRFDYSKELERDLKIICEKNFEKIFLSKSNGHTICPKVENIRIAEEEIQEIFYAFNALARANGDVVELERDSKKCIVRYICNHFISFVSSDNLFLSVLDLVAKKASFFQLDQINDKMRLEFIF